MSGDEGKQQPLAVVTGSNTGIGFHVAGLLASRGYKVVLACRSVEKAEQAVLDIKKAHGSGVEVEVEQLDLGSFGAVRDCARRLTARYSKLEVLVCNAGLAPASVSQKPEEQLSKDGVDVLYQCNALSHLLLILSLMPLLVSAGGRVISMTSGLHRQGSKEELSTVQKVREPYSALYSFSMLAKISGTEELFRRFGSQGVSFHTVNPGGVASDLWRNFPAWQRGLINATLISPQKAAQTVVQACTCAQGKAPAAPKYWNGYRWAGRWATFETWSPLAAGATSIEAVPSDAARDPAFQAQLWEESIAARKAAGVSISPDGKVE